MDIERLVRALQQTMEALEIKIEEEKKYKEALDILSKENQFMHNTIMNQKMGKITSERRKLLERIRESERASKEAVKNAKKAETEYHNEYTRIKGLLEQARKLKTETDRYIQEEAENMAQKQLEDGKKSLARHKKQLEEEYGKKAKKTLVVCAVIYGMTLLLIGGLSVYFGALG